MENNKVNLMNLAPRCVARSKRSKKSCRAPAVRGWKVCRMHGAKGGAPKGSRNGNYRHGEYTQKALAEKLLLRLFNKQCLDNAGKIGTSESTVDMA